MIAYKSNNDLPVRYRVRIISLEKDIETLNLLEIVSDAMLDLAHETFSTKPLAMPVSQFEKLPHPT